MADLPNEPPRRVALIGNPNVGKTTLFNLLTGMRQKVGNYPGVTVERKVGRLEGEPPIEIIDLPGSYSLSPKSADERVAYDVLMGHLPSERVPDLVVCVVDASNLERNLYLVSQVMDTGLPTIVALNMTDAAESVGLHVDTAKLEQELGLPVIPMVASRSEGVGKLKYRMRQAELPPAAGRRWDIMPVVEEGLPFLMEHLEDVVQEHGRRIEVLQCLTNDAMLDYWKDRAPAFHAAVHEERKRLEGLRAPYQQSEIMGRYNWISPVVARVVRRSKVDGEQTLSDRIDAVVTHRVAGPLLFALLLLVVFQAVFSWATPLMDLIEGGVAVLGDSFRTVVPGGMLTDLIVDGVIAGVGNVVIFLPQILLLFFFLGLMEDTGYMARSAFIMDRLMNKVGLSGGSVVPLLSSFACAIPGIMAARTLANPRDRLITIMVAPLMSCSARLPVYTLFIAAFLPTGTVLGIFTWQGVAMFSMYLLGTVMAFVAAFVLRRFVFNKGDASFFAMELPPYRMPRMKQILWRMVDRSKAFVVRAGKIIFGMSIILWVLATFPRTEPRADLLQQRATLEAAMTERAQDLRADGVTPEEASQMAEEQFGREKLLVDNRIAAWQVERSAIGRMGHFIEPVMRPLGFDWKMSAGIISAFAAREVIISALATIYSVGDVDENSPLLREQLKADTYEDGSPVYTPLVAVSLLVFFVLALQCMSTLAIARRETNSWKWPFVMWLYMTGLAYLFSLVIYQGGQALGWG